MVKLIIFDFWGTLVDNNVKPSPVKQVKYILRINDSFPLYIIRLEKALMTSNFDSLKDAFVNVCKEFEITPKDFIIDKLIGLWNKKTILAQPMDDTLETLKELKKDYKLVLLSNTDNISSKQVMEKFDLAKYFDKLYLSYETGLLKTNPKIFEKILKEMKVAKKDAIMVGDSMQSDVQGASNAGIKAVLFDRYDKREFDPKIKNIKELRGVIENE